MKKNSPSLERHGDGCSSPGWKWEEIRAREVVWRKGQGSCPGGAGNPGQLVGEQVTAERMLREKASGCSCGRRARGSLQSRELYLQRPSLTWGTAPSVPTNSGCHWATASVSPPDANVILLPPCDRPPPAPSTPLQDFSCLRSPSPWPLQ